MHENIRATGSVMAPSWESGMSREDPPRQSAQSGREVGAGRIDHHRRPVSALVRFDTHDPALFHQQGVDPFIKLESDAVFKGFSCKGIDGQKR
jgi:hypothetical protein